MQENYQSKQWIKIKHDFLSEAHDLMSLFLEYFLSFQKKENTEEDNQEILRILHSIKGASLSFGFDLLSHFIHQLESLLILILKNQKKIHENQIDFFIESHYFTEKMLHFYKQSKNSLNNNNINFENLKKESQLLLEKSQSIHNLNSKNNNTFDHKENPTSKKEEPIINNKNLYQLKIDASIIQEIHQEISKLFLLKFDLKNIISCFHINQPKKKNLKDSLSSFPKLSHHKTLIKKNDLIKIQNIKNLIQNFDIQFSKLSEKIYQNIKNIQLIEINKIAPIFLRLHYQIAKMLNKKTIFNIIGNHLKLEKWIIETSIEPIIQIIKNAFDHGIESPEERKMKGKNPKASINLKFKRFKYKIIIEIQDDGQGIQIDKLINKAKEKGIHIPNEKNQIQNLIFHPGLSTKSNSNLISGRGIGLDIVKNKIEKFKGHIFVQSKKDQGSLFQITFPLEYMMIDVLLFKIDQILYAIPIEEIEAHYSIKAQQLKWNSQNQSYDLHIKKKILVFIDLQIFHKKNKTIFKKNTIQILICKYQKQSFALKIDHILKEDQILTQENPIKNKNQPWLLLNGILKNGKICFIIDIEKIFMHH